VHPSAPGRTGGVPFSPAPDLPPFPDMDVSDDVAPREERPPWTRSFLWWRKGEGAILFWVLLIHAGALVGLVFFPVPGWPVFAGATALMFLGGLGTTVGYHRSLAHRAARLHRLPETVLTFLAIFNGSGAPASWASNHRMHHAYADKENDISSPKHGGFWWSHLRWLWQAPQAPLARWAPDLDTPYYRFWARFHWVFLAFSLLVGLPFGWAGIFWMGPMRLVLALHAQCFVNSIAHMRPDAAPGESSSQNIPWLGVIHFFQGENWHGNHHAKPWSARLGWTWWQFDLGWVTLRTLRGLGLARKVH
jgi:fatty-acid desaturase